MSEFVGRTGSRRVYSYPEPRRSGGGATTLARNFATGPKTATVITGAQIEWNAIDAGTSPSADVPITPVSSGIVIISGVVAVVNNQTNPIFEITLEIQIDGVSLPIPGFSGIGPLPASTEVVIPFLTETTLPIGPTSNVQILVAGDGASLMQEGSAISVQEVPAATG